MDDEKPKFKKPMSEKHILARKLGGINRWKKAKEKQQGNVRDVSKDLSW